MTISSTAARPALPRTQAEPAHGPDLIVEDVIPSNAFPYGGDTVTFDVVVKNQGDQAAGPFNLKLTAEQMNTTVRAQQLAAGASLTFRQLGPLYTHAGQSLIWVDANVDTGNEVAEKREDNNYLTTTLSVQDPFPPSPPYPGPPPFPH